MRLTNKLLFYRFHCQSTSPIARALALREPRALRTRQVLRALQALWHCQCYAIVISQIAKHQKLAAIRLNHSNQFLLVVLAKGAVHHLKLSNWKCPAKVIDDKRNQHRNIEVRQRCSHTDVRLEFKTHTPAHRKRHTLMFASRNPLPDCTQTLTFHLLFDWLT